MGALASTYHIRTVSTLKDCERLQDEWEVLAEKHRSYAPYLSYDWFRLCLDSFAGSNSLLVLLLYKNNTLECIAPFLLNETNYKTIRVRRIELIGNVYSPIRSFICNTGTIETTKQILLHMFQFLSDRVSGWDIIDLKALPHHLVEPCREAFSEINLKHEVYPCFANWYEDGIKYSGHDYIKGRGSSIKRNVIRNKKKLEKLGKLEFKMITGPTSIDKYIKLYFEVYTKSWKEREAAGPDFIKRLVRLAAQKGWLRFGFLFFDAHPIAAGFAFVHQGITYFPKSAFDPDYGRFGVGAIWLAEMMKYFIDIDKVHTIDLLRGDESYKSLWVSKRRERKGIIIFNNNLKGTYLNHLVKSVLPMFHQNKYLRNIKEFVSTKLFRSKL